METNFSITGKVIAMKDPELRLSRSGIQYQRREICIEQENGKYPLKFAFYIYRNHIEMIKLNQCITAKLANDFTENDFRFYNNFNAYHIHIHN